MRRGGITGRGGHSLLNVNPPPLMSMGPLLTSQNQLGLQDIDLELELLKRKREIIEQQQQMLRSEYSGENRFNQISHLYPESRGFFGEGSGAAKKRPSVWEHEANAPKRFNNGNTGLPRKTYTSQSHFTAPYKPKQNSQPSYQSRSQYSSKRRSKSSSKRNTDFKPTKVTKPSASVQPPNNLNTHPAADRQKYVTAAVKAAKEVDESLVLRADREPNNQLAGRLGLALGYILKQIKAQFPQYEDMFKNPREMKLMVRERLNVAMMGKYVGSLDQILKVYREVYPPETDREIVMRIIEAESSVDFLPVESDDPQEFYMKNLGLLMSRKMDEMFTKLYNIYRSEHGGNKLKTGRGPIDNTSASVETPKEPAVKPENSTDDGQTTLKTEQPNETDSDDKQNQGNEKQNQGNDKQNQGNDKQNQGNDKQNQGNGKQNQGKGKQNQGKGKQNQGNADKESLLAKYVTTKQYQEMDRLMTAKLPLMLKKYIPLILKTIKLDGNYRRAAAQIRNETKKKIMTVDSQPVNVEEEPEQDKGDKDRDYSEFVTPKPPFFHYSPLPYYVKILGRPSLPKRNAMQEFFAKYQPKSIKKHRTVHNLLFVGFSDKETFNNIIAADGTQIGRFTLSIKVSERLTRPPVKGEDEDDVKLINAELDDQITDLLDSIKKSEGLLEEDTEGVQEDDVIEVPDDIIKVETIDDNEVSGETDGVENNSEQNDVTMTDNTQDETTDTANPVNNLENGEKDSQVNVTEKNDSETEKLKTNENGEKDSQELEKLKTNDTIEPETSKPEDTTEKGNSDENVANSSDLEKGEETENPDVTQKEAAKTTPDMEKEKKDTVTELKSAVKDGKATPTRTSARIANTPSSIRTRRASKLGNDNQ